MSGRWCATRSSCSTRSSAREPSWTVGEGPYDDRPNRGEPGRLNTGITVVGKRAIVPRGARIGRNVKVGADVRTTDFVKRVIKSGDSVERRPAGQVTRVRKAAVAKG